MVDWSSLRDVGGSAEQIPGLLKELEASRDPEILSRLWNRLCHQGSVFSASFAALPNLIRIAEKWHPRERLLILSLAVSILSGNDIDNLRRPGQDQNIWTNTCTRIDLDSPTRNSYQNEIDTLLRLTEESLQQPNLPATDFTYLLGNILTLKGYLIWKEMFEYFALSCLDIADLVLVVIRKYPFILLII